jgi:hypothetical protein
MPGAKQLIGQESRRIRIHLLTDGYQLLGDRLAALSFLLGFGLAALESRFLLGQAPGSSGLDVMRRSHAR